MAPRLERSSWLSRSLFLSGGVPASSRSAAYRHYCRPVATVDDLKLAPFHLLASEGQVRVDTLAKLSGDILIATNHRFVEVTDEASVAEGIRWWPELTGSGAKAWS